MRVDSRVWPRCNCMLIRWTTPAVSVCCSALTAEIILFLHLERHPDFPSSNQRADALSPLRVLPLLIDETMRQTNMRPESARPDWAVGWFILLFVVCHVCSPHAQQQARLRASTLYSTRTQHCSIYSVYFKLYSRLALRCAS